MNQTTPQITKFEDRCSKCLQSCTRLRRPLGTLVCTACNKRCELKAHRGMNNHWGTASVCCEAPVERQGAAVFVTSCCNAKPLAVPVVKE